jgi:guanylate kinase
LLDIDVKGAIHVQQQFAENVLSIFVEAPSVEELQKRLESRGTETAETLHARLSKAAYELSFKDAFDIIILNDDLHSACLQAEKTVAAFLQS